MAGVNNPSSLCYSATADHHGWQADVITSVFNLLLRLGGELSGPLTANRVISVRLCAAARRLPFYTHSFAGSLQVSTRLSSSFTFPAAWVRTGGLSG